MCVEACILHIVQCQNVHHTFTQSVIQAFICVSLCVQWLCRLWVHSTQCSAPVLQPSWSRRGRCTQWSILSTLWPCNTLNTPLLLLLLPPFYLQSLPLHPSRSVIFFFTSLTLKHNYQQFFTLFYFWILNVSR